MRNLYQNTYLINRLPDSELWKQFKKGDEAAFSVIFHKYYSYLYNYGNKIKSDKDLIKDSIQELFIILWESRERLGDTESIKFYLLKSFRRHLIRSITSDNKNKDKYNIPKEYQFEFVFCHEENLILEQSFREQQIHLLEALNELSPRQKEVIYLKFYDNLSYREISEITSLHYQSVRNYIHQAIQILRKKKSLLVILSVVLFIFIFCELTPYAKAIGASLSGLPTPQQRTLYMRTHTLVLPSLHRCTRRFPPRGIGSDVLYHPFA